MSPLANLKIRTKLLIALLPLVIIVIAAALYSSIERVRIDTAYTELIDNRIKALQSLTKAGSEITQVVQSIYQEIAELDLDRMRVIEVGLDNAAAKYNALAEEATRKSPDLMPSIKATAALFNKAISDARPVRDANFSNNH